jgi:hypothetical protein
LVLTPCHGTAINNNLWAMKPLRLRSTLWVTALVLAVALGASWLAHAAHERRSETSFRGQGFARAAGCAETIAKEMAGVEQAAHSLKSVLDSANLAPGQVPAALVKALEGSPSTVLRLGVLSGPASWARAGTGSAPTPKGRARASTPTSMRTRSTTAPRTGSGRNRGGPGGASPPFPIGEVG